MKTLLTTIALISVFTCFGQNWDQRFEHAKFEYNQGNGTFIQDIIKNGGFTYAEFQQIETYCEEDNYFFKIEFLKETSQIRFYHFDNVDAAFMMQTIREVLGTVDLTLGEMSRYSFEN